MLYYVMQEELRAVLALEREVDELRSRSRSRRRVPVPEASLGK